MLLLMNASINIVDGYCGRRMGILIL